MSNDVYETAKQEVIRFLQTNTSLTKDNIIKSIQNMSNSRRNSTVIDTIYQCKAKTSNGGQCTFRRKDELPYCMKHNTQHVTHKLKYGSIDDNIPVIANTPKTVTLTEIVLNNKICLLDELTSRLFTNDGEYVYMGLYNP